MSEKKWLVSKNNGIVLPWSEILNDPVWVECNKNGVPLSEIGKAKEVEVKVEEVEATVVDPTLEDLKEQAKGLGIRGYNNAKKDTLIKKIAEAGAEDGEEEGS